MQIRKDGIEDWELISSGKSEPLWFSTASSTKITVAKFSKLTTNIQSTDVVVIGGGIAGITVAYMLAKVGRKIVVLEDGHLASGETGRTTAHITHALDDRYYNFETIHGRESARHAADSHTAAMELIESIIKREEIDCEFERLDGYLFLHPTDKKDSLDKELKATYAVGITGTEIIKESPLRSFDLGPCLRFPNQAQFQPLKYIRTLAERLTSKYNVQIFTETHAKKIDTDNLRIETSEGYSIAAQNIVIATNAPIVDETSKIYDKQEAYRTYVIAARIRKGVVPKALYWDTGDQKSNNSIAPYHYVRIYENMDKAKNESRNDGSDDLLVVGGEDHRTGEIQSDVDIKTRYDNLEKWARERFPIEEIVHKWSGQVMEPYDSLALIGLNPGNNSQNIFIATGDSGNGITHGTIAGILLTDLILGKSNPWTALYDPSRKPRKELMANSGGVQLQSPEEKPTDQSKHESNKRSYTKSKEMIASIEDLKEGQGIILEEKNIAAYKDHKGQLHTYSATCTHLGCTVTWNNSEKSFDCPCHGSRFSPSGNVINGPANIALMNK
jgi:glycine/D-amino acid oxidase-like deaminating enzyme/nitrite reductase/ring-hydroxylating ferredoxin subunit